MVTFNEKKFKELILHVADQSQFDPQFGVIKLNKIMFYADFAAFVLKGNAITGAEYIKLDRGPAPRLMAPIRSKMEQEGDLMVLNKERFGLVQRRVIALREPDLADFTADEIALVDRIIGTVKEANATEISEASHGFLGWQLASDREVIPYEVALVSSGPPTEGDITRAKELAVQYDW